MVIIIICLIIHTVCLQRLVTHYDQIEHKLFSGAREAEAQRKKQSQVVQKMQNDLEQLKRENAKRLKVSRRK